MKQRWEKGSFTVEASIIIPIFLFVVVMVLNLGISLYVECSTNEDQTQIEDMDMVSVFYRLQMMYELVEKGTQDGT